MAKSPNKPVSSSPDPVAVKERPRQDAPNSMTAANDVAECMDTPPQPEESLYRGKWRNQRDGFLYKHCVFPHYAGKTHKAMIGRIEVDDGQGGMRLVHTGLFWEGNPEDFHATFRMESPE